MNRWAILQRVWGREGETSTVIEEHFKNVSYNHITDKSDMAMNSIKTILDRTKYVLNGNMFSALEKL